MSADPALQCPTNRPGARDGSLIAYFVLAYAISWLLWLPLVATVQGWWSADVPRWWHYTGAAGPVTAAVCVAAATRGKAGVRQLLAQYSPRRAPPQWLGFAVVMPVALFGAGAVLIRLVDGAWPTYEAISKTDNLPFGGFVPVLIAHTLTFGLGEETGWRGFALPRLQSGQNAMRSTHLLAIFWAPWHLPTFFENESMMDMSLFQVAGWLAGIWMGAIFLTWLFNSSGGSLLVVVTWHGLFNLFSASNASSVLPMVETMGVIAIAIVAIWMAGPEELTGLRRRGHRQQLFSFGGREAQ